MSHFVFIIILSLVWIGGILGLAILWLFLITQSVGIKF